MLLTPCVGVGSQVGPSDSEKSSRKLWKSLVLGRNSIMQTTPKFTTMLIMLWRPQSKSDMPKIQMMLFLISVP
jgi:hypothetical protein